MIIISEFRSKYDAFGLRREDELTGNCYIVMDGSELRLRDYLYGLVII